MKPDEFNGIIKTIAYALIHEMRKGRIDELAVYSVLISGILKYHMKPGIAPIEICDIFSKGYDNTTQEEKDIVYSYAEREAYLILDQLENANI